jgi:hypothetical protein
MRALAWLGVLLAGAPASAREGTILFTRLGSVYEQPADLSRPAVEIAELPDDATEVRWLEPIRSGRLVVVNLIDYPTWVFAPDPAKPAILRGGPCTGRARPNPWGGCLFCPTREGPMLVAAGHVDQAPLPVELEDVAFLGDSGFEMGGRTKDGQVVAFDRRAPAARRVLAAKGPGSHLIFAPDGTRGVGVFGEGIDGRVRTFMLDGDGVSRQLGGPGYPTVWSWDSAWVLFQEGDIADAPGSDDPDESSRLEAAAGETFLVAAPRRRRPPPRKKKRPATRPAPEEPAGPVIRACAARATGGEVKCWEGYTGLAFSPDATLVLLKRERSLYVGKIAGVRPEPPVKIIDDVDGAATWVPAPQVAAPLPAEGPPGQ